MSASTLPLASRERSHAWHSPVRLWGWEQVMSAGGLGHSPLCLATSDRISSSPGMQRAMGEVHDDGGGGGVGLSPAPPAPCTYARPSPQLPGTAIWM